MMGRRSRARAEQAKRPADIPAVKERGRAGFRRRIQQSGELFDYTRQQRPKAPWDPFPLVELTIFFGIIALVAGTILATNGRPNLGSTLVTLGIALAAVGGLDNSLREHFSGYRSHSILISGFIAVAMIILVTIPLGDYLSSGVRAAAVAAVTATGYWATRAAFLRRSGGRRF